MNCLECGNEFESKRQDAKFCTGSCRAKFSNRKNGRTQQPQQPVFENKTPQQIMPMYGLGNPSDIGGGNIVFALLREEKIRLENKLDKSEAEIQRLNEVIQTLRNELQNAKIDLATKDRMQELEMQQKNIDAQGGLGFVDKVTSNDRLMDFIEKIALAKLAPSGEGDSSLLTGLDGTKKELLESIVSLVKDKSEEFLAHLLNLVSQFTQNEEGMIQISVLLDEKAKQAHQQQQQNSNIVP